MKIPSSGRSMHLPGREHTREVSANHPTVAWHGELRIVSRIQSIAGQAVLILSRRKVPPFVALRVSTGLTR
jgi:hypothetical protein